MTVEAENYAALSLSMQPPGRAERRLAIVVATVTVLVGISLAPIAGRPLPQAHLFLPIYQSALTLCDFVTAILLFEQFDTVRSRAVLTLASGYLFSALMAVFHALSFPGLFSEHGLLGSGMQTTAWLRVFWHLGFSGSVIVYARMSREPSPTIPPYGGGRAIAIAVAAVLAIVGAIVISIVVGHDALLVLMDKDNFVTSAERPLVFVICLIILSALPLLWRHGRYSVLDLWLMLVTGAWLCDAVLSALLVSSRFSLGWYAGRIFGLFASSFLLVVFIIENGKLQRRLARSYVAEHLQRRLVEERTAELSALNQSLEQRVAARTAELEASNRALEQSKDELKEFAIVGVNAREQERTRLARELHDEFNQALVLLRLELSRLEKSNNAGDTTAALQKGDRMRAIIDHTLNASHRMAGDLRPLLLDDLGFAPAAQSLVETFARDHGIDCELEMDPPEFDLLEPYSIAVFRVMQESLANIARHANAKRVDVLLSLRDDEIRLSVRDDGCGFDLSKPRKPNSFGLVGLRERIHIVSGRVEISSAPGQGTLIDVSIPIASVEGVT